MSLQLISDTASGVDLRRMTPGVRGAPQAWGCVGGNILTRLNILLMFLESKVHVSLMAAWHSTGRNKNPNGAVGRVRNTQAGLNWWLGSVEENA